MVPDKKRAMMRSVARALLVIAGFCLAGSNAIGCKQKTDSKEAVTESAQQVAVPQDPAKAREHFERGVNHSMKKEFDKAIMEYSESIRYNPGVAAVHSNLAFAYADLGNLALAISEYKKALEIEPSHANSYYGMAMLYEAQGNKDKAIKSWEEYIKLTESHSTWWNKAQERLEKLKSGK